MCWGLVVDGGGVVVAVLLALAFLELDLLLHLLVGVEDVPLVVSKLGIGAALDWLPQDQALLLDARHLVELNLNHMSDIVVLQQVEESDLNGLLANRAHLLAEGSPLCER